MQLSSLVEVETIELILLFPFSFVQRRAQVTLRSRNVVIWYQHTNIKFSDVATFLCNHTLHERIGPYCFLVYNNLVNYRRKDKHATLQGTDTHAPHRSPTNASLRVFRLDRPMAGTWL